MAAGAGGGMASFLNLKQLFQNALMQRQWQLEDEYRKSQEEEKRSLRSERGAMARSMIGAGYTPKGDAATMLAGGGEFTPPDYTPVDLGGGFTRIGTRIFSSVGERTGGEKALEDKQMVGRLLRQGISSAVDRNGQPIPLLNEKDATNFVLQAGLDPNDPDLRSLIKSYPKLGRSGMTKMIPGAGGRYYGMGFGGGREAPSWLSARPQAQAGMNVEDIVRRHNAGDASASEELLQLIENGTIQYDENTGEISY
jgi:hypothetical protein